jgi:hypothetical protein
MVEWTGGSISQELANGSIPAGSRICVKYLKGVRLLGWDTLLA